MNGKLLNMIRKSAVFINKQLGFQSDVVITTPSAPFTLLETKGIHTQHHLSFDTEGQRVSSKNAHILISEDDFKVSEYPYRNQTGNVHLKNHKVTVITDGETRNYIVLESYPSDTFGMIVLILKDINSNITFNGTNTGKYFNPKL